MHTREMSAGSSREVLLDRLLKSYESSYDITVLSSPEEDGLCAKAHFHVEESSYILTQRATMWSTNSDEYVWFFSMPTLKDADCEACIHRVYDEGMACIDLSGKGQHMVTRLVAVFLCDDMEDAARVRVRKCRIYKSFQFSLKGWMEFHAAAADLGKGAVVCNGYGRDTGKHLEDLLHPGTGRRRNKRWAILKQMLH